MEFSTAVLSFKPHNTNPTYRFVGAGYYFSPYATLTNEMGRYEKALLELTRKSEIARPIHE